MKHRITHICLHVIALLLLGSSIVSAWTGESNFVPESREEMKRIAGEMIDFHWSPPANYTPWGYTFNGGQIYYGEAYTQNNPQESRDEFYKCFDDTPGNDYPFGCSQNPQNLGNDCSGFVSMAWKLKSRWGTGDFINDVTGSKTYVHPLGDIGSGQNVKLMPGDAMVKDGHILLFESYQKNQYEQTIGINTMEQMCDLPNFGRCWADHVKDDSHRLWPMSSYRPIRRNKILDNYFDSAWYSSQPVGIALDSSGYLYVADQVNHLVNKYTGSGGFVRSWSYGTPGVGFSDIPKGIAVGSGFVYVADDNNTHVKKFDTNGSPAACGGTLCSATFNNIGAIAVDSSGNVYVGDSASTNIGRIQKFSSSGSLLTSWNGNSTGLALPTGIATDAAGYVYVLDSSKVWKYTSTGSLQFNWDATGGDSFADLHGIAIDSAGDIYVVDTMSGQVNKFMNNGTSYVLDIQWGTMGTGGGQFNFPLGGIVADSSGHVWVADTYNSRVQKFSPLPKGPSNLTANADSSGHIDLSWLDNSENETGFYIKRKQGVRGIYSTLIQSASAGQTTYDDPNVSSEYTYYYAVWAKNSYGDSAYSNEVKVAPYTLTVSKSGAGVGTVASSPSGINCGTDCDGGFDPNATVTLTATPNDRSKFSVWSGNCTGTGTTCTLTMNTDKNVTAYFDGKPVISETPASYDFGSSIFGFANTFTVTNVGLADLSISSVSLSGANSSDFNIPFILDNCTGHSLVPYTSCSFTVELLPGSAGSKIS